MEITKKILTSLFDEVGEIHYTNSEVEEKLLREPEFDSFQFALDLRSFEMFAIKGILKLGRSNLTYEQFIQLIHPNYILLYMQWGAAAYKLSIELKDKIFQKPFSYSILIPIKMQGGSYWWVNQCVMLYQYDKNKNIVSQFNIYRIIRPYRNMEAVQPVLRLFAQVQEGMKDELLRLVKPTVIESFFGTLKERHKKVIRKFWERYSLDTESFPSNEQVAHALGFRKDTIDQYNKQILVGVQGIFGPSAFRKMRDLILFLYDCFGEFSEQEEVN